MIADPAGDLAAAKDRMATLALGGERAVGARLGKLSLRPHQQTAVARLLEIMTRFRGALLADAVGLGKTYVALAIAREHARPLVVCPAALRTMWERARVTSEVDVPILTVEGLARGERPSFAPDVIIVDEAHHIRTPATRRYEAIASLAHRSRLLLMSATPLHNSRRDLTAVLALFAGSGVSGWSDRELARLIVRRDEHSVDETLPRLDGPHALSPGADDDCLDAIVALPAAVPAADEGTAAALAAISMVHLWASSRAALVASLRKRRARAIALRDAIASGHLPTSAELAAWQYADDALQLAFPFCVGSDGPVVDASDVARRLDEYVRAVGALIASSHLPPDPDVARAGLLRALRARHIGDRVVAFSQYAQTVTALGRLLRADSGVAVVTADGAQIASGAVTREEVLAQFAGGARPAAPTERVDLLLSTDLLSEGVDLRGAAVIVHLDLPWNPARLEQRVGRARRLGSEHEAIHVYTFVPPAAAERMLELERRLSAKVRIADDLIGGVVDPMAGARPSIPGAPRSKVRAGETLRARMTGWLDPTVRMESRSAIVAAAEGLQCGWIAVVSVDGFPRLIHSSSDGVGDDLDAFMALADQTGDATAVDPATRAQVLATIDVWLHSRRMISEIGATPAYSPSRRAVLDRISQSVARAPRHRRAALLAAAHRARTSITSVSGIGAERVLATLARSPAGDDAWIHSVEAFGSLHWPTDVPMVQSPEIGALILISAPVDAATR